MQEEGEFAEYVKGGGRGKKKAYRGSSRGGPMDSRGRVGPPPMRGAGPGGYGRPSRGEDGREEPELKAEARPEE
jgi:hypothetical protein